MNGAKLDNTGKYAIAGGNEEIIHLCEQNHSSFEDAYEAAIKYHKNDIFKYLYENNSNSDELQQNDYNKMIDICIKSSNFEILFLENETQIDNSIINETAKMGNLYLVKHFIEKNQIPKNILVFSLSSDNTELVKFILLHNEININAKDVFLIFTYLFTEFDDLKIIPNIIKILYTALILASKNGYTEIVKLLLEQEGIDINAKDIYLFYFIFIIII